MLAEYIALKRIRIYMRMCNKSNKHFCDALQVLIGRYFLTKTMDLSVEVTILDHLSKAQVELL